MAVRRRPSIDGAAASKPQKPKAVGRITASQRDAFDEFLWNILSISNFFEEISFAWAQMLGVNVHQWMILMAIRDLDRGNGVSVTGVSAKLHADPSFVTQQSKNLEKLGFLRRANSAEDARVVLMSLTSKASKEIGKLLAAQEPAKKSIFCDLEGHSLDDVNAKLSLLREKFQRTAKRLAAEL
ncbi:MAG: MarR family transcriptional regulator [Tardiphaga sp.]|jgi:DNA-binding MarR family transcriptional regulator|nr:MarR family transcriptional regulator [Tardiphaga sp.]